MPVGTVKINNSYRPLVGLDATCVTDGKSMPRLVEVSLKLFMCLQWVDAVSE